MIKVHIREQFVNDCLDVFIINQRDDERLLLHLAQPSPYTFRWDIIEPPGSVVWDAVHDPTFVLPFDSGRALLEALTRHYNGAEDTRQLRKDYDAERKRVDEQSKVIAEIARTLAGKSA